MTLAAPSRALDEARSEGKLAEQNVQDVFGFAVHSKAAWNASDEAETEGAPLEELTSLRMRLINLTLVEWLPRAIVHATALPTINERAAWFSDLAAAMRAGACWYLGAVRDGVITSELAPDTIKAAWDDQIVRLERAARQAVAS